MNAIVSICHFCELHGPSVVFCTQAFRDVVDLDSVVNEEQSQGTTDIIHNHEEIKNKVGETDLWKYGRLYKENYAENKNGTQSETCVACQSFLHTQPGFISNDDSARVSYVTSQYPLQHELYILVRHACMRSLSCESCPGREGPIYFGDEARGHVLSYTFFLRDVQARGFQRWYSILVLMKDKMLLLNSWPFIVRHVKQIINLLQDSASKIYESEESKVSHRALRSRDSMDNHRRQRVAGQPRSLSELVGEEEIWKKLHTSFTWLLKAGGLRLQERLVEGPPVSQLVVDGSEETNNCGFSIRDLHSALGSTIFHRLLHHLLIGRQVILRGSCESTVTAIIQSLQPLLPKHCNKAIYFSPHYIDHTSCNLLGLHTLAQIPQTVIDADNLCLVDMKVKEESCNASDQTCLSRILSHQICSVNTREDIKISEESKQVTSADVKKFSFQITQESVLPARPPQLLTRIEAAIGNPTLSPATLRVYLSTVIYEWINKVKVWIHIQGVNKVASVVPEQRIPTCTGIPPPAFPRTASVPISRSPGSYSSLSRSPVSFGTGSPEIASSLQDSGRHQLLSALSATEWDVPLLEFWSKNFKPNVGLAV